MSVSLKCTKSTVVNRKVYILLLNINRCWRQRYLSDSARDIFDSSLYYRGLFLQQSSRYQAWRLHDAVK
jgi:hypothetical protein